MSPSRANFSLKHVSDIVGRVLRRYWDDFDSVDIWRMMVELSESMTALSPVGGANSDGSNKQPRNELIQYESYWEEQSSEERTYEILEVR